VAHRGNSIMRRNIGIIDQTIRAILGLALIALGAQEGISIWGDVLSILVAAYLLVTAIVLHCPLYRALGLSSYGQLDRSM